MRKIFGGKLIEEWMENLCQPERNQKVFEMELRRFLCVNWLENEWRVKKQNLETRLLGNQVTSVKSDIRRIIQAVWYLIWTVWKIGWIFSCVHINFINEGRFVQLASRILSTVIWWCYALFSTSLANCNLKIIALNYLLNISCAAVT